MKRRVLVAPVLLLIACAISSALAYARILDIERPRFTFLDDFLTVGTSIFSIISEDECVGEITLQVHKERATIIQASGSLRAQLKENPIDVEVSSNFYFNPLGQMTDSTIKVHSLNLDLLVATEDINPINLKVLVNGFGKERSLATTVSGPLIINEYKPNLLRLEYSQPVPVNSLYLDAPVNFIKEEYKLNIVNNSDYTHCKSPPSKRLDLARILPAIQKFTSSKGAIGSL